MSVLTNAEPQAAERPAPGLPFVTVVIPCLNEAQHLTGLLDSLAAQNYSDYELIVVDGGSTDGTVDLIRGWQATHPDVPLRLLHNPAGHIPHALNLGIAAAAGEVIVRLDGHSRPAPDYLRQCLVVLAESGAAMVGGTWTVRPGGTGRLARAIALAVSMPLGAGDAHYRLAGTKRAGAVDHVPFGCFRRGTWAGLKGYNESLLTNEDYEFNLRVRRQGGVVYLDPRIRCEYFARPTLGGLARQYWRYGWWKAQMLKRNPGSLRLRQAVPLIWSLGAVLVLPLALVGSALTLAAIAAWSTYLAVMAVGAAQAAWRARDLRLWPGLVLAFFVVHFAWGLGAWSSFLQPSARPA